MNEKRFKVVGLGEVLWDVLPTGKKLGGAPANFAYISSQIGNHGIVASRVGVDKNGREIMRSLEKIGVGVSHIQTDAEHSTGTVSVSLANGQPSYEIKENAAWDFLKLTEDWRDLAKTCDAVCFGTLAQRNAVSRHTIQEFIKLVKTDCLRIFDVNLRQNYFSPDVVKDSLNLADVVKLNHEELPKLAEMFAINSLNQMEQAKKLCGKFKIRFMCLTRGGKGSLLLTENEASEHCGIKVEIADTIGAGDSFTAAMTNGILRGWHLDEINEKANRVGAFVAAQIGAMPDFAKFERLFQTTV
jgi:fructokinase